MTNARDRFYDKFEEPTLGCLLALKEIIMSLDEEIEHAWKYGMPFFVFRGKMFCYLWTDEKTKQPYIGFVEGKHLDFSELIQGNRARMKILNVNPSEDLPIDLIRDIVTSALLLYKEGKIKTKR